MSKFAFLIESLAVQSGGPARVAALIAGELADRGHAVSIWTLDEPGLERVPISPKTDQVILATRKNVFFNILAIAQKIRLLSKSVDAVIVSGIWGPVDGLALSIADIPSHKLFIRTCGMLEPYILNRGKIKKYLARTLYVNRNINRACRLLSNTKIEKRNISSLNFLTSVEVIPNGVRLPESHLSRAEAAAILGLSIHSGIKFLLYLGRVHPKKGLQFLLPAFAEARAQNPGWHLLVAGSFSDSVFESEIRRLIPELNLTDACHFVGEVAERRKEACFSIASAFTLPSQSEGFPNAVVEAMSWRLPCLITPGCNFPELQARGGGIEVDITAASFAARLSSFLSDEVALATMGETSCRIAYESYSLSQIVDLYERLPAIGSSQQNGQIGILFSSFGPYHVARIDALASALARKSLTLCAYRFSERSITYGWEPVVPANANVVSLLPTPIVSSRDTIMLTIRFFKSLKKRRIRAMFLPSYSPLPNFLCLLATRLAGARAIMMNDSWSKSAQPGALRHFLKHVIFRLFHAGLVAGQPQAEYAVAFGIPKGKIFTGYDVVDVDYFAHEAKKWRSEVNQLLLTPPLPDRYFLNIGRFVKKKNLLTLVQAYATFINNYPETQIALVLVGAGEDSERIEQTVKDSGILLRKDGEAPVKEAGVIIYPFQQYDKTPLFFSKAEAFILPSKYEEWGLVVNEAMACSTPVIVSNNAGCSKDLVIEGRTGFTFDPSDSNKLARILEKFETEPLLSKKIGDQAFIHIQNWRPERFGEACLLAIEDMKIEKTPK